MPRPKKSVPAYSLHKPTGQAYVRFTAGGTRRVIYLGKYDSPESQREYERVLAELRAGLTPSTATGAGASSATALTLNEVFVRFLEWADGYYRRADGTATNEAAELRLSI